VAATVVWLRLDRLPPTWDDAWYLTNSLVMFDALVDGGVVGYFLRFWTILGFKGPLITVLPTPAYLVFGRHANAAFAVNIVAMVALFAVIYRMARKLGGERAALVALFVCGTMPMLYGLSRWFLVECTMTAMVALAILCLVESRVLAFGIVCGFGMLLKSTFPIYVALPFLYWAATHRAELASRRTWLALSPAVLLPGPWYAMHFRANWRVAVEAGTATREFYGNQGPLTYLVRLIREGPSFYYAGLLIVLAAVWVLRRQRKPALTVALLWTAPFLFFVFGPFQETRYTAPLLPGFALAIGLMLELLTWRPAVACAVLAFPLIAMVQNSFGVFGAWRVDPARYVRTYDPRKWPRNEIVERLGGGRVLMASDTPHLNADTLQLAAREQRRVLEFSTTAYDRELPELLKRLDATAYVIYKEGGSERDAWVLNKLGGATLADLRERGDFAEAFTAPLPDGGVARVLRNVWRNSFRSGPRLDDRFSQADAEFGGQLALTGMSVEVRGGALEVKYRWRCLRSPDRPYWCFTHILDEQGRIVGYLDHPILDGDPPTDKWLGGDEAIERRRFRSEAIQPGNQYRVRVGVFDKSTGGRLAVNGGGTAVCY